MLNGNFLWFLYLLLSLSRLAANRQKYGTILLDIIELTSKPEPDDWAFVFSGHNAITPVRRDPGSPWKLCEASSHFLIDVTAGVPLGKWDGKPAWAFSVPEEAVDTTAQISNSLYSLLGRVHDSLFSAHGRAYQLLNWLDTHRYCGRCGTLSSVLESGNAILCSSCSLRVYPRVAPCVIVLVTKRDKMLLAAAAGFKRRFYSTLAGFMEPGENCEQAVRREVLEEVGIEVSSICYFSSQPWPFPSQLMLGFTAEWQAGEINPDPNEIEDAAWYCADNMPPTPPNASISGQLISNFINLKHGSN